MHSNRLLLVTLLFAVGCGKSDPPPPDGSCGIQGICILPEKDNPGGERIRWAGVRVDFVHVNHDYAGTGRSDLVADRRGTFRVALIPGDYSVGVYDPIRLKHKFLTPMFVKVSPGMFAPIFIDYDELNVHD